jgi:LacI family transcriptional regulator
LLYTFCWKRLQSGHPHAWEGTDLSVTIKDVARQANVSVATVSRALNGHENVAEAVRTRVLAVARELRYSPHHAARSLSSRRTNTIGVVLPDLYGEFFSELMRGIDQIARDHGQHLLVSSYHGNPQEQAEALRTMRGRVDGLLLMSPYADDVSRLSENLVPTQPAVLINSQSLDPDLPSLVIDNRNAAAEMVRHLAEGGCRRIAFIGGPSDNFDARDRLQGYRDALGKAIPDADPWVVEGDFTEASGHAAAQQFLAAAVRPDAVFAANDMMALGCLFALQQAGVDVPGEIAVAGFDDIPLARYAHPSLTTMRVDIAGLGAQAMQTLLARLKSEPSTHVRSAAQLDAQLIVRDSTRNGPAAARRPN